ncbi:MAG: 2-amino-4-hydroxy-6-hydroxymethyldihydropteridine diphosphokinase [Gammaproteobacteria bacterium]|nr:2-amino-4-hydroxy-6-hydroxymethyldihydropteridine diphosphokinase [Gammaproteobacteria bacterium]
MKTSIVYIGLGSNIQQPEGQIKNAIITLNDLPDIRVIKDSGYFKSKPMGPGDQPDYVNAVVELETSLDAVELLQHCKHIEQQQGRVKLRHWGERCIDLDILLYEDQQIHTEILTVPHPGICLRDFVFMPLLKLNPEIEIPGAGRLDDITQFQKGQATTGTDYNCHFTGNIDR